MFTSIRSLALATALLAMPAGAIAQELTPEQQAEADRFAVSHSISVMFHEIGHMLVHELDIPVLGREEDAADAIAMVVMLTQDDEDDRERAVAVLEASITGWFLMGRDEAEGVIPDHRMADEHSLKRQRAFQVVCFMVGSDPEAFTDIAERYGLTEARRETCVFDYDQSLRSWARLLAPHFLDDGEPIGNSISIAYGETEDYAGFAALMREDQLLEEIAESLNEAFVFPRPIEISTRECGYPNAYYETEAGDVVFCYELAALVSKLYGEHVLGIATAQ